MLILGLWPNDSSLFKMLILHPELFQVMPGITPRDTF